MIVVVVVGSIAIIIFLAVVLYCVSIYMYTAAFHRVSFRGAGGGAGGLRLLLKPCCPPLKVAMLPLVNFVGSKTSQKRPQMPPHND